MGRQLVKEEFTRFCQTTSIKGIPRAVKAENIGVRLTWIISVFAFITVGIFQTYCIIAEYLKYSSYIFTHERIFDPHENGAVIPTITLCNENPFSSLKLANESLETQTLDEYYVFIDQATQCPGCNSTTHREMQNVRSLLRNPGAYFENLGHVAAETVSHDLNEFLMECKEVIYFGMKFVERQCTDLISIRLQNEVDYFNCYRIEAKHEYDYEKYGFLAGLSAVLYLDNIASDIAYENRITDETINRYSAVRKYGAIVTPTHFEGYPFVKQDGIHLAPGMSGYIKLYLEKKTRLPEPHGDCVPTSLEAYEYIKMCMSDCYQKFIRNQCNCTDARMVKHMDTKQKEFCLSLNHYSIPAMLERYSCATRQFTVDNLVRCTKKCPSACSEISYTTETSFTKWPSHDTMKAFYQDYIANKTFEPKFRLVKEVIEGNCSDMNCLVKLFTAQRIIEDNFLQVNMQLSDFK